MQPIVTCIRGTNEEEAFAILRDAGLEPLTNTEEAANSGSDIAVEGIMSISTWQVILRVAAGASPARKALSGRST